MKSKSAQAGTANRTAHRIVCLVMAALPFGGGGVAVGSPPAKGKPAPPASKPSAEALPTGCVVLHDSHRPIFSVDGKRLVFERSRVDPVKKDAKGNATITLATWIRDMATGKEARVIDDTLGEGFASNGTLMLRAGYGIEPTSGARAAGVATLPSKFDVLTITWSRDGQRVAYVPAVPAHEKSHVFLGTATTAPAPASGTVGLRTDQTAILAWSPDGLHLLVNALFDVDGETATRRVGLVDAATGEMKVIAEMPDWINLPGYHGGKARYKDPRHEPGGRDRGTIWYPAADGPRHGRDLWDAEGRRFAWVEGGGWLEADVFVGDRASGERWRITNDGEAKWSPAIDRAGRRVAFLMADDAGVGGAFKDPRVRVVDLYTGEPTDYPVPEKKGVPASLVWSPDGKLVAYEVMFGEERTRSYLQTIAPPKPLATGAALRALELTPESRVIAWLASYDAEHVHAAVHRAEDAWSVAYVPAMRAALKIWAPRGADLAYCIIGQLGGLGLPEVAPEIRIALASPDDRIQRIAGRTLARLVVTDALADLRAATASAHSSHTKISLAASMVRLGDETAWGVIEAAMKQTGAGPRRDACASLWRIQQPKSVELLIPLVSDMSSLGEMGTNDRKTVGDAARCALEALTGRDLGAEVSAWTDWWTGVDRKLPTDGTPPKDLMALLSD